MNGNLQLEVSLCTWRKGAGHGNLPLAPPGDDHPGIALLVNLLLDLGAEADGAHDAVAELLVQDGLVCVAVVLDDLVQAVDERLDGGHGPGAAAVGDGHELGGEDLLGDVEERRELLDVLGGGLGLAVEQGGDGDLAAVQQVGDLGEAQAGLGLCVEELRDGSATGRPCCTVPWDYVGIRLTVCECAGRRSTIELYSLFCQLNSCPRLIVRDIVHRASRVASGQPFSEMLQLAGSEGGVTEAWMCCKL